MDFWSLLYRLSRQGTTIFLTTHYMDEAARCTDIGFIQGGRLIAKGSPLRLKQSLQSKLLEVHVKEVMDGMEILGGLPEVYGVELRSGRLRIHARDSEALLKGWLEHWPYENLCWLGYSWVEPDLEDVFIAYSQSGQQHFVTARGRSIDVNWARREGRGREARIEVPDRKPQSAAERSISNRSRPIWTKQFSVVLETVH